MAPGKPKADADSRPARVAAIDFARGVAVCLMILSHGVKGLLTFEQIPDWGMVPIHLVTKFSSTLFFLVFGVALASAYMPFVGSPVWPEKRKKLLIRGLIVLFWYKVLTIVEMWHLYPPDEILGVLLYQGFPVYSEILGFYAIALLWIPFALPVWRALPSWARWASPLAVALVARWLHLRGSFWGSESLHAILIEHDGFYTWGQLTRLPIVLFGLLVGEAVYLAAKPKAASVRAGALLLSLSMCLFAGFYIANGNETHAALFDLARNEGKHPPELGFMAFSVAGAFSVIALTFFWGERLAKILKPITIIGTNALQAFIFHLFVLFVVYRFLLDYWHKVTYTQALQLTITLIVLTSVWIKTLEWIRRAGGHT